MTQNETISHQPLYPMEGADTMDKNPINSIQRARIGKGLTQEALAERAGCSVDSVRESGARNCPIDMLGILSEILAAPWLTGVYLREQSTSLDALIPEFRIGRPLPEVAAAYISCILDFVDNRFDRALLRMVADGHIDDVEAAVFEKIMDMGSQITKAYYEMRFAARKE